ncbi:MAG: protein-disulfide reductase DsbD domain-containing protein [Gemmobacter sp.]
MMTTIARPLFIAALLALPHAAASEQTRSLSIPQAAREAPVITGSVRPGWRTEAGGRIAGVELRLAPGWKTYWRAPGDSGIPPLFDWSRSENVKSARILWPRPEVSVTNGLRTIGYHGTVVLPVEVTPRDPAQPMRLRGHVDLGVCRDVCIPAELTLDAGIAGPGAADPAIRAALKARPATAREAGLTGLTCRVEPIRDGLRVHAEMTLPPQGGAETVVVEPAHPGIWVSDAAVTRRGNRLVAVAEMVDPSGAPFVLDRSALVVTVLGQTGAVEHRGCPAP